MAVWPLGLLLKQKTDNTKKKYKNILPREEEVFLTEHQE